MGHYSDDELANAFYLYDHRTGLESISYLQAAKDRIRWLSRQLYTAPPASKQGAELLYCDTCGAETENPWHYSTSSSRHNHACDACWLQNVPPASKQGAEPVAWGVADDEGIWEAGSVAVRDVLQEIADHYGDRLVPLFYTAPPAVGQHETLELTEDLTAILGRPNFSCAPIADRLRAMGQDIPKKAEHEQAAVIYFLLCHYLKDRKGWHENATQELRSAAPEPDEGGE